MDTSCNSGEAAARYNERVSPPRQARRVLQGRGWSSNKRMNPMQSENILERSGKNHSRSSLDGSCSINGFVSACAMVMSFASAGGGGEFGFLCQGNCDAFNSGAIRIGADNVPYAPNNEPISPSGFDELQSDLSGGFLLSTGIPGSDGGPADDRAKCKQAVLNDLNQAGVHVGPSNVATPPGKLGTISPLNDQGAFLYRGAWNFYIFTPEAVDISPGQRWGSGLHVPRRQSLPDRYAVFGEDENGLLWFTAHSDSANASDVFGILIHLVRDVVGHKTRNHCPGA